MPEENKIKNVDAVEMNACDFLKEVDAGSCVHELTQAIEAVVKGIRETSKKGNVTLKLELEPFKGDPNRIVVGYHVKGNAPQPAKPISMFFSTLKNTLQRTNPLQAEFEDGGF